MRSLWAVLAGFILIGILNAGSSQIMHAISPWAFNAKGGTFNPAMLFLAFLLSSVFGIVGCYVTARLAPSNPMKHALALGVMGVVTTGLMHWMAWGAFPGWYSVINPILVLPLAWIGGRLRESEMLEPRVGIA